MTETIFSPLLLEIKRASLTEAGEFSGYITSWGGQPDHQNDVVMRGAFTDALAAHRREGTMPALLWNHQASEPIGRWIDFREDDHGLLGTGRLTLAVQRGAEALALMRDDAVALSIGFTLAPDGSYTKNSVRYITKVGQLAEVSVVALPANVRAKIVTVKKRPESPRELEHLLRDAGGYSHRESKAIVADGFRGLARDERNPLDLVLDRIEQVKRSIEELKHE